MTGDARLRSKHRRARDRLERLNTGDQSADSHMKPPEKLNLKRSMLAVVAILCLVVAGVVYGMSSTVHARSGFAVQVGDVVLGVVEDPEVVDQVLSGIVAEESASVGLDLALATDVTLEECTLEEGAVVLTVEELHDALIDNLSYVVMAYVINVDGQDVVALSSEDDARGAISDLRSDYIHRVIEARNSSVEEVLIREAIDFELKEVPASMVRTREETVKILARGTDKTVNYSVQRGDSLWAIAQANQLTVEDLRRANPEVTGDLLQIGQELNLVVPDPYVTLASKELYINTVNIPYSQEVSYDSELWPWQETVLQAGKNGQKQITQEISRIDGNEVARVTIEEKVLSYPVIRKIIRGSKQVPAMGSGEMAWPVQGTITSKFGMRWGRLHAGVDIGAPTGTQILAADTGMVAFAGWNGGYGNFVKIDHGGGKQTWYGHMSKISVSVGQSVNKGDVIGTVGSTGNSTGPHLHFEVRIDGVAKDPLGYYK